MKAQIRVDKLSTIRNEDQIPGVIYGQSIEPLNVQVDRKEFFKYLIENGQTSVFPCEVDGKTLQVYIKDLQREVMHQEKILHFDLLTVVATDKIHANLPIHLQNKEFIEKQGLIVNHFLHEIDAKYGVTEKPEDLNFDVAQLKVGDLITVNDLSIPDYIEVLTPLDTQVLSIVAPKVQQDDEESSDSILEPELVGADTE